MERLRSTLRALAYSLSTERAYCGWVVQYHCFCRKQECTRSDEVIVEQFLFELAVKQRLAAKTQDQAIAALRFLHNHVLERPLGGVDALRAKRPVQEWVAPSPEQIAALRNALKDVGTAPVRLIFDLLYGCGLRVSEPLNLRIRDLLWDRKLLVIRGEKGGKDRLVPLPRACEEPLRAHVDRARRQWEADRSTSGPGIGVTVPRQRQNKQPSAPYAWQWFWVFPGPRYCRDPFSGSRVRRPMLPDSLQQAVRSAAITVGLDGWVTPHVLRHAYARHSREPIEVLRTLMGDCFIATTAANQQTDIDRASNPLDDLAGTAPR
jgi:site-specific recombinase XerD